MLLVAGSLMPLLGIALYLWLRSLPSIVLGTDILVHSEAIAAKDWPFSSPQMPSFHRLYVRIDGFQDHTYYFAFSGEGSEVQAFVEHLAASRDGGAHDSMAEIREINDSLKHSDPDYVAHGWDLTPGDRIHLFVSSAEHQTVLVNEDWTRVWYFSFTM